jgi:hypothetical protein
VLPPDSGTTPRYAAGSIIPANRGYASYSVEEGNEFRIRLRPSTNALLEKRAAEENRSVTSYLENGGKMPPKKGGQL